MAITNTTKPNTSIANSTKVSIGETWASIATTWASETREWLGVSQLFTNSTLEGVTSLWAVRSSPWKFLLPWQVSYSGIINTNKPN